MSPDAQKGDFGKNQTAYKQKSSDTAAVRLQRQKNLMSNLFQSKIYVFLRQMWTHADRI